VTRSTLGLPRRDFEAKKAEGQCCHTDPQPRPKPEGHMERTHMTRKKDTDPATPTQAADIIPAGHGLDAIKTRIGKMRQQSPVREPGKPVGRGPLLARPEPAPTQATPPPLKPAELEQCTLPGVPAAPKGKAPIGNQLARTPLFAPIKRGRRKIHGRVHGGGVNSGVVQAGGEHLQPGRDWRGGHRVNWL
jgi:hypothetical protein